MVASVKNPAGAASQPAAARRIDDCPPAGEDRDGAREARDFQKRESERPAECQRRDQRDGSEQSEGREVRSSKELRHMG